MRVIKTWTTFFWPIMLGIEKGIFDGQVGGVCHFETNETCVVVFFFTVAKNKDYKREVSLWCRVLINCMIKICKRDKKK